MARPTKEGLDYFPLDVDIEQDEKVALIEAQHGTLGFAIIIKLFMRIYKNGYFYEWGEKEQLLFSKIVNVDINSVNEVINDCLKWGLFDTNSYEQYRILTSRGVQSRYLEATIRRKEPKIIKEYCLLSNEELNSYNYLVIVNINGERVEVIDNKKSQSKVKESKGKKSNEEVEDALIFFDKNIARISEHIKSELMAWIDDFNEEIVLAALKISAENNATTYSYVNKILIEWRKNNLRDIDQVRNYELRKRAQRKTIPFKPKKAAGDIDWDNL